MAYSMYKISGTEATLISSECNPEISKGSENSSDLYILNKLLFWYETEISSSTVFQWDDIGENTESIYSGGIIFAISDGALYSIKASGSPFSFKNLGDEVDWLSVTGKIPSYTSNTTYYAHAIRAGGKLYSISCDNTGGTISIARVTVSDEIVDGFTYIKGTSSLNLTTVDTVAFGIADGKLYAVCGANASQVGSEIGWTSVSDFYNSNAFGICSGKLYYINASGGLELGITASASQEGSLTGWTKISGYNSTSTYPIAICDGKLYRIAQKDFTQIGTETGWTHIGGYCSQSGTTGYGICNGKLYAIEYNSVTQIGTESDWMYLSESGTIAIRGSDSGTGGGEEPGGDDSGTTGIILNGLFLSSVKPKLGQKGLLLDNKYFLPLVEGSGSAEYYRCASVDTSTKTWTGYKAVLNDGIYTFESTVTSGLTYSQGKEPQVGYIYTNDASIGIRYLPVSNEEGIISLVHFDGNLSAYPYGSYGGSPEFVTGKFGQAAKIATSSLVTTPLTTSQFSGDFTIDMWVYLPEISSNSRYALIAGTTDYGLGIDIFNQTYNMWASSTGGSWNILQADGDDDSITGDSGKGTIQAVAQKWTHIAYVHEENNWYLFIDGVLSRHKIRDGNIVAGKALNLGKWPTYQNVNYLQIDEFCVHDRAVWTSDFTPPTGPYNL